MSSSPSSIASSQVYQAHQAHQAPNQSSSLTTSKIQESSQKSFQEVGTQTSGYKRKQPPNKRIRKTALRSENPSPQPSSSTASKIQESSQKSFQDVGIETSGVKITKICSDCGVTKPQTRRGWRITPAGDSICPPCHLGGKKRIKKMCPGCEKETNMMAYLWNQNKGECEGCHRGGTELITARCSGPCREELTQQERSWKKGPDGQLMCQPCYLGDSDETIKTKTCSGTCGETKRLHRTCWMKTKKGDPICRACVERDQKVTKTCSRCGKNKKEHKRGWIKFGEGFQCQSCYKKSIKKIKQICSGVCGKKRSLVEKNWRTREGKPICKPCYKKQRIEDLSQDTQSPSVVIKTKSRDKEIQEGEEMQVVGQDQGIHGIITPDSGRSKTRRILKRIRKECWGSCGKTRYLVEENWRTLEGKPICKTCYEKQPVVSSEDLPGNKKQQAADASTPLVVIKTEPVDPEIQEEVQVVGEVRELHEIDNSLAILQDPMDPKCSVLLEAEGPIEEISIPSWSALQTLFPEDRSSQTAVKEEIKRQMREWLTLNEDNREGYKKKLDDLLEINIPVGLGPDRGRSVYAKRDIKQFEVIGPYQGKLHLTENSLHQSMRRNGVSNIQEYSFGTRSQARVVDGYKVGNTTSLINTAQLLDYPKLGENNVVVVQFGKNLNFYVAARDITKDEELFIDYGPNYNPTQPFKREEGE